MARSSRTGSWFSVAVLGVVLGVPVTDAGAGCPAAPRSACRAAGQSRLKLKNVADDTGDRLAWTFAHGPATSQAEFGSPAATTGYTLCAWGPTGLVLDVHVPAGGTCAGLPCWAPRSTTGYLYKDVAAATAGVQKIKLAGSPKARTRIAVAGRGATLPDATLPLVAPMTVQLLRDDAAICFESIFPAFVRNDAMASVASSLVDTATPVPPLPSAGCGHPLVAWTAGVSTPDQLVHDGLPRTFRVYVPPSYDPTLPAPVVVLLHGGFGSGAQIEASAGILEVADANGFIVVSPDGVATTLGIRTWNAGGCCGYAASANVDDVGFVAAILDRLEADACVDRRRVYAEGMSNGAMLSHRLACDLADRIRAIGPVAGTDMTASCAPARPVPVREIHGTDDEHVPFLGGLGCGPSGVSFASIPFTLARWSTRDGCDATPLAILTQGDGTCTRQGTCAAGTDVDLCVIAGGGHQWPGGTPPAVSGTGDCPFGYQSATFSAAEVLWDFFAHHPPR